MLRSDVICTTRQRNLTIPYLLSLNLQYNLDFDTSTLATNTNWNKRNILEMIHIKQQKTSINFRSDTNNLLNVYNIFPAVT